MIIKVVLKTHRSTFLLGALLALTALLYSFSLSGPFVYDDIDQIYNNEKLHQITNLKDVVFCGLRETRLVMNLFFATAWSVAPRETWPFHATLLVLHLINGLLVFSLLRRLFSPGREWVPLIGTALFLLHSLQIQGVVYIMGGTSVFQAFFYLLALRFYDTEDRRNDRKIFALIPIALLCKESCALIPATLVAWDLTISRKSLRSVDWKRHARFFGALLLAVPFYLLVQNPLAVHGKVTGTDLFPYGSYLLTQAHFYLTYLKLIFDSSGQSLVHEYPRFSQSVAIQGAIGAAALIALFVSAARARHTHPVFSFFTAFFFISMLPTGTFIQAINPFAEYRLYQPNISVYVALAAGAAWVGSLLRHPAIRWLACLAPLAWLSFDNYLVQKIWTREAGIIVFSLANYPTSYQLNSMMGAFYEESGRFDLAEEWYVKAETYAEQSAAPIMVHPSILLLNMHVRNRKAEKQAAQLEKMLATSTFEKANPDYYRLLLEHLRANRNRERFESIRRQALQHFPGQAMPEWK